MRQTIYVGPYVKAPAPQQGRLARRDYQRVSSETPASALRQVVVMIGSCLSRKSAGILVVEIGLCLSLWLTIAKLTGHLNRPQLVYLIGLDMILLGTVLFATFVRAISPTRGHEKERSTTSVRLLSTADLVR